MQLNKFFRPLNLFFLLVMIEYLLICKRCEFMGFFLSFFFGHYMILSISISKYKGTILPYKTCFMVHPDEKSQNSWGQEHPLWHFTPLVKLENYTFLYNSYQSILGCILLKNLRQSRKYFIYLPELSSMNKYDTKPVIYNCFEFYTYILKP